MQKWIETVLNKVVDGVCMVAKANVACATGLVGYQRKVPQGLSECEVEEN